MPGKDKYILKDKKTQVKDKWQIGKNHLTDNGLISLTCKVHLENKNTNNPIEKWAKNMKYKQLLNVCIFIIDIDLFQFQNDCISGRNDLHKK